MRVWRLSYLDEVDEQIEWYARRKEPDSRAKHLRAAGFRGVAVDPVDIPTRKILFVRWLNDNARRG